MIHFARGLFMVLGLATFAACGGDSLSDQCKDGCSDADCDGTKPTDAEKKECETGCDTLKAFNEKSGCTAKGDDAADECSDVDACDDSTPSQACSTASTAYFQCVSDYCAAHANDSDC